MNIYSIGFNNSLITSKNAICFLKMTLEHSSVANFQVILAHFKWWLIFVKLLDNIFLNIRPKSILLEINFIKEKRLSYLDQELLIEWTSYKHIDTYR